MVVAGDSSVFTASQSYPNEGTTLCATPAKAETTRLSLPSPAEWSSLGEVDVLIAELQPMSAAVGALLGEVCDTPHQNTPPWRPRRAHVRAQSRSCPGVVAPVPDTPCRPESFAHEGSSVATLNVLQDAVGVGPSVARCLISRLTTPSSASPGTSSASQSSDPEILSPICKRSLADSLVLTSPSAPLLQGKPEGSSAIPLYQLGHAHLATEQFVVGRQGRESAGRGRSQTLATVRRQKRPNVSGYLVLRGQGWATQAEQPDSRAPAKPVEAKRSRAMRPRRLPGIGRAPPVHSRAVS
mmetsp:Transcript_13915/g.33633  ORF Transcript_13915/g.33633 Transcript_13915/m.33633 type:complete len:297 (-) Transcript_13915:85-975(-)